MHERLWKVARRLDSDYEPYGKAERDGSDCSCGCRHFVKLAGDVGNDRGVCSNPGSPRAHARRWIEGSRDRLKRCWQNRDFQPHEATANKAEYREMLKDEEQSVADGPNRITEAEAFVEWLKGIDRSNPTLESVPCPEPAHKRSGKR